MATTGWQSRDTTQSLSDAFERQVANHPDRLAVDCEDYHLSYRELNRTANRLASTILQARGETCEPVALLLEHGAPAILGVLGSLKAGKIYVPMDPSFPATRNQFILQDSQAAVVLTNNRNLKLAESLAQGQPIRTLPCKFLPTPSLTF